MNKDEELKIEARKNIENAMDGIKKAMMNRANNSDNVGELIAMHADCMAMLSIAYDNEEGQKIMSLYCKEVMAEVEQ